MDIFVTFIVLLGFICLVPAILLLVLTYIIHSDEEQNVKDLASRWDDTE